MFIMTNYSEDAGSLITAFNTINTKQRPFQKTQTQVNFSHGDNCDDKI